MRTGFGVGQGMVVVLQAISAILRHGVQPVVGDALAEGNFRSVELYIHVLVSRL